LFRLLKTHQAWTTRFLAEPSLIDVADTYGHERLHPMRDGRSPRPTSGLGVLSRPPRRHSTRLTAAHTATFTFRDAFVAKRQCRHGSSYGEAYFVTLKPVQFCMVLTWRSTTTQAEDSL
jgi:hypothetical protein